jgi:RNA polymerase sigma-70 factor (ECF subfamily)
VYAFIRSQVATPETAQELVSASFLKAYRHRHKAPREAAGVHWLFRIAHNTLIDYWRVDKRHERASVPIDEIAELRSESISPEDAFERKQQIAHLLQLMNDLPKDDRVVLALKFSAHRTNRDIAAILSLSEGAVSMRLLRALRRLRERFEEMGWE